MENEKMNDISKQFQEVLDGIRQNICVGNLVIFYPCAGTKDCVVLDEQRRYSILLSDTQHLLRQLLKKAGYNRIEIKGNNNINYWKI